MPETFGKLTTGTELSLGGNYIRTSKFPSGSAGFLQSISLYVKEQTVGAKVKCAIYDSDLNLLANGATEEKTVPSGQDDWLVFNFSTPPEVAATTDYLLAIWNNDYCYFHRSAGDTNQYSWKNLSYNSWPEPLAPGGYGDYVFSIYATYTEVPPPAKKTLVQAALISIPPLIVLPTLREILRVTGGC